ncbi:hypothetical protein SCA6_002753 [Theobroma cacao]
MKKKLHSKVGSLSMFVGYYQLNMRCPVVLASLVLFLTETITQDFLLKEVANMLNSVLSMYMMSGRNIKLLSLARSSDSCLGLESYMLTLEACLVEVVNKDDMVHTSIMHMIIHMLVCVSQKTLIKLLQVLD